MGRRKGSHLSEEQKAKLSTLFSGVNNPFYGRRHSRETKDKIRSHLPDMQGSNNPHYGHTHSAETKRKISIKNKGRKMSDQSKLKMSLARRGPNNARWKGGRRHDQDGYVLIWSPNHPYASSDKYVFEHRLIMESILGKYLTPNEVVHHINGTTDDNRPENLLICSNVQHWIIHRKINRQTLPRDKVASID